MKQPIKPFPPFEYTYKARTERRYIYKFSENLQEGEDDFDDDEDKEEDKEDASLPKKDISKVTLSWLIKQIPDGLRHKDIKIEFGFKANCMAYENHYVNFYYEVKIPAQTDAYKAAKEQYQKDLKKYEQDLIDYNEYCKNKEIKETEEKLAKLKEETKK